MDHVLHLLACVLAQLLDRVDRLRGRSISDGELAARLGISRKTLRRWIAADAGVLSCCVVEPRGAERPGKTPLRRWRAWEVEARWSGAGRPKEKRRSAR